MGRASFCPLAFPSSTIESQGNIDAKSARTRIDPGRCRVGSPSLSGPITTKPKVAAIKPEKPGAAVPKAARKKAPNSQAEQAENSGESPDQPIIVHNMDFAKLDVVIEHGFEQATASVLVDKKPLYSQELHGESKRRGLLFHKTQGKQSGTINLLPGKHDILVRVQSPSDGYDATSTLSEGFSQGSKRVLLIKCDKRKNKLAAVIQ